MKVLLTGAAGFIGLHVAQRLLERGDEVVGLDNLNDYYDVRLKEARLARLTPHPSFRFVKMSVEDRPGMAALFAAEGFDRVVHLAAQAGVRYSLQNPDAYIDANIVDEMVIADLAAVAGLSPHHFGGAFRTETGVPPHRFVMERRVERAKLLLRTTDTPVTSVATALGFSSPSHFTVCFRRMTGSTPSRFREARA